MKNSTLKYIGLIVLAALIGVAVFMFTRPSTSRLAQPVGQTLPRGNEVSGQIAGATTAAQLVMPISVGLTRVSKKPFGLYVTPETSPVPGDVFTGYHTGLDFETTPDEQNTDVAITAACDGKVLVKEWAKGYGGVFVQSCKLDGQDVTVIYGHLKLESITPTVGQTLLAGDSIGVLGQGFSHETDGRRKHLHFDIHKATEINILGYVPKQDDLANWVNPMKYLE